MLRCHESVAFKRWVDDTAVCSPWKHSNTNPDMSSTDQDPVPLANTLGLYIGSALVQYMSWRKTSRSVSVGSQQLSRLEASSVCEQLLFYSTQHG